MRAAKPLTIAVVGCGSAGDFNPLLALSRALEKRGHAVDVIAPAAAAAAAARLGLRPTVVPDSVNPTRALPARLPGMIAHSWAFQGIYRLGQRRSRTLRTMRWVYRQLAESRQRYSIVVGRVPDYGARFVRDALGIPFVGIVGQPAAIHSVHEALGLPIPEGDTAALRRARAVTWRGIHFLHDRMHLRDMNRFRREVGLPPIRETLNDWAFSPDLNIGLFPPWYGAPRPDWPLNTHLTGFFLYDGADGTDCSGVDDFLRQGQPPVVITRGTRTVRSERFFEVSVEACGRFGVPAMLVASVPESVIRRLPSYARHFSFAPFSSLLPRAAAVIHHGGIGTTAQAIAAGTPQLVVPIDDDQWDQGKRLEKLGLGLWVHPRRFGTQGSDALASLLRSEEIRRTCQRYAAKISGADPVADACRLIEELGGRA